MVYYAYKSTCTQGPLMMFAYNDIIYMVYKAVCYMIQHRPALSHL